MRMSKLGLSGLKAKLAELRSHAWWKYGRQLPTLKRLKMLILEVPTPLACVNILAVLL